MAVFPLRPAACLGAWKVEFQLYQVLFLLSLWELLLLGEFRMSAYFEVVDLCKMVEMRRHMLQPRGLCGRARRSCRSYQEWSRSWGEYLWLRGSAYSSRSLKIRSKGCPRASRRSRTYMLRYALGHEGDILTAAADYKKRDIHSSAEGEWSHSYNQCGPGSGAESWV